MKMLSKTEAGAVREILMDILDIAETQITPEARIKHDLGADSLHVAEIGMAVEERFQVELPDEGLEQISTVSDLCESLASLLEEKETRR